MIRAPRFQAGTLRGGSAIHGARLSPSGQEGSEEPARVWCRGESLSLYLLALSGLWLVLIVWLQLIEKRNHDFILETLEL